jgi:DNA-binding transcriptional LysR family regulator
MDLEREIGAPLFKRSHHRVELTESVKPYILDYKRLI